MEQNDLGASLWELVPTLSSYVRSMVRDQVLTEDLVQDTLVRALERIESLEDPRRLRPWLFRIAHNLVIDRIRGLREEPSDDVADEVERRWQDDTYTVDAAEVIERAHQIEDVRDALTHLPAGYRAVLLLHDGHGLTSPEVADALGIGIPAAKQRLRRGRMMLVSTIAEGYERGGRKPGVPLRCWDARRQVSAFMDDELDRSTRTAVVAHLSGCPTCPPLYSSLVETRRILAGFPDQEPDPDTVVPPALANQIRALRKPSGA